MTVNKKSLNNLSKAKRFTSENQPKGKGRKPSIFKKMIAELDELGESLSLEDFIKIVKSLLVLNKDQLIKIAQGKKTPIVIVVIASSIAGDIENKQLGNLDRLLDRIFGKSPQKIDTTLIAEIENTLTNNTTEVIFKYYDGRDNDNSK